MDKLILLRPSERYAEQVMAYKREMQENGGILENEVPDDVHLTKSGIILRYWINC